MPNSFKLFGAKDTGSFHKSFERSLWKLTLQYVLILSLILFLSSSFLYSEFSKRLEHRYRVLPQDTELLPTLARPFSPTREELQEDLFSSLIFVNGILLLWATLLSYWLAKRTLEPLKKSYEKERIFFADASHELRTPLSILKIDLENRLNSPSLGSRDKDGIKSNLEEVDRMARLVDDLLSLSRLENEPSLRSNLKLVDIGDLLEKAIGRLRSFAEERQVELNLTSKTEKIFALSDEELLTKITTNLLKNAILYNKPKGQASLLYSEANKNVIIDINDTGIGMSRKELKRVFDRFYRADKSRSRQTGGSGLGLSIVEASLRKIGGLIEIKSEEGVGASIRLTLPKE